MNDEVFFKGPDRRSFLKSLAGSTGALALGAYASNLTLPRVFAASPDDWTKQIGIQLNVFRQEMTADPDGSFAKIADIGFKAFAPVGFSGMDPKQYRALLDKHGIIAPNIDLGFSIDPNNTEKGLEGCQVMGCKSAEPGLAGGGRAGAGGRGAGGTAGGATGQGGGRGRGATPPQTEDSVKQTAADYNKYGGMAKKYGIKVIFHNHVEHFELLQNSQTTLVDLFLSETDPDLVGMELDISATAIAGRNIPDLVKKYPGRFPVWDIGDAFGIKAADMNPNLTPNQRRVYTYAVPVGLGDIDYKTLFASAQPSGLQYAMVSQANAAAWGDPFAAARISYQNLTKLLS